MKLAPSPPPPAYFAVITKPPLSLLSPLITNTDSLNLRFM